MWTSIGSVLLMSSIFFAPCNTAPSPAATSPETEISDGQIQSTTSSTSAPVVSLKNGTYSGSYNPTYNQDFFLGIPFAQPPVGDLRWRVPQSLNESFSDVKAATAYSSECPGYGSDDVGYTQAEDCLYLNVIRPTGIEEGADLPVAVWIHGGGLFEGGTADKRYNLSFIVENSVQMGKPIIGMSIQYRLSGWGFLGGAEALAGGATNLGFRDQRLALHWIQENIAAFGGDPSRVTIWGESAGAQSVGYQITAYNGRDDGLFRAGIAESGGPAVGFFITTNPGLFNSTVPQENYNFVVTNTSCASTLGTNSSLDCLRTLPFAELNATFAAVAAVGDFTPVFDNDFIADYPSSQLDSGHFVKVPLLIGSNTDEGTSFAAENVSDGTDIINTDAQFLAAIKFSVADNASAEILTILYPDIPAIGIPSETTDPGPGSLFGKQSKRAAAYFGDAVVQAPRRAANHAWARHNVSSYSYRFDVVVNGITPAVGATHFQEVAFVFDNVDGLGYAVSPFANQSAAFPALARQMSRSWVAFVHDLDPNGHGIEGANVWPRYVLEDGAGKNFVWSVNETSFVEEDTWRAAGIKYISSIAKSGYGR